ncbi:MAG: hypothetical protein NZ927_08700 [Candidatus Calescibacterium sp.]|nr:hypothetical protein [Candidatus Calescibacterium sp.]MCX7733447.1 hypothetical protein [bacterium]MDW8087526.1 hypothetical protein [Candidatus Calescibacterium sp.]
MRITIKDLHKEIKIAIFFFCLYCLFGPFVNFGYHVSKKGVGVENVQKYYLGSEEEMIPPQSEVSIFEVMHFHTWSQASAIFILSAIFSISSFKYKTLVIASIFIFSLGHIFLPSFVRFINPNFAYLLFLDTVALSVCTIFMALWIIKDLFSKR